MLFKRRSFSSLVGKFIPLANVISIKFNAALAITQTKNVHSIEGDDSQSPVFAMDSTIEGVKQREL